MKEKRKKQKMQQMREFNTTRILAENVNPVPLSIQLISNPFFRDQEKFHYISYQLKQYNKRIKEELVSDPYQIMVFEKMHSIMCDIPFIETKDDQISRLNESYSWFQGQQKLISQRKQQGYVRYQVTNESRKNPEPTTSEKSLSEKSNKIAVPYLEREQQIKPYIRKWRTIHREHEIPKKRLNQNKRKIINILPIVENKAEKEKQAPRIIYPKIEKLEDQKEEEEEKGQEGEEKEIKEEQKKEEEKKEQEKKEEENVQQDLGGFGQEPEEPQEEEKIDEEGDKLKPRFKNFTIQHDDIHRRQFKESYLFFRGQEDTTNRRIENKFLKKQYETLKLQREDSALIDRANSRGENKFLIEKYFQKKLQNSKLKPKYQFSIEKQPLSERLTPNEQIKYGLISKKTINRQKDTIDFSLPKVNQKSEEVFEKTMRKEHLRKLRTRFKKLLNLEDQEERENMKSICQNNLRRRGFSQILNDHSKSKEKLKQLDEVMSIKEKLNQFKANLDIRSISMGLCLPESDGPQLENNFPEKDLPSNPMMVEPKKKKKK